MFSNGMDDFIMDEKTLKTTPGVAGLLLLLLLPLGLPVANALDVLQPCGLLYCLRCSNSHHQSSPK
jgi:hypothetical protein